MRQNPSESVLTKSFLRHVKIVKAEIVYYVFRHIHCCMKYPRDLREKTLSQKSTVIALRKQWKVSAEGNTFRLRQENVNKKFYP